MLVYLPFFLKLYIEILYFLNLQYRVSDQTSESECDWSNQHICKNKFNFLDNINILKSRLYIKLTQRFVFAMEDCDTQGTKIKKYRIRIYNKSFIFKLLTL